MLSACSARIIRDLNLPAFGYEVLPLDSTFTPFPDGRYLLRDSDAAKTRHNIAQFSQRDAERYPEFGKTMGELGRLANPDYARDPDSSGLGIRKNAVAL